MDTTTKDRERPGGAQGAAKRKSQAFDAPLAKTPHPLTTSNGTLWSGRQTRSHCVTLGELKGLGLTILIDLWALAKLAHNTHTKTSPRLLQSTDAKDKYFSIQITHLIWQ